MHGDNQLYMKRKVKTAKKRRKFNLLTMNGFGIIRRMLSDTERPANAICQGNCNNITRSVNP